MNVQVTDEPYTHEFVVNSFDTDFLFKIQLRLGFKVNQRVNTYLYQIVGDLIQSGQLTPQDHKYSIYREHSAVGDFRFCLIRKVLSPETAISGFDRRCMEAKYFIRGLCGSPARWYGLENSSIVLEFVPLFAKTKRQHKLIRVPLSETSFAQQAKTVHNSATDEDDDEDIFTITMRSERVKNVEEAEERLVGGDTASFKPLRLDQKEDDEDEFEAPTEESDNKKA